MNPLSRSIPSKLALGSLLLFPVLVNALPTSGAYATLEAFGAALFHDTNLSLNRTQSCATCHSAGAAFSDARTSGVDGAVSLGDDGQALGSRNSPTIMYSLYSPPFHAMSHGVYRGGQFHDGRARSLPNQVNLNGGPFLNPDEMMMPSRAAVIQRVRENPDYVAAMQRFFGQQVFAREEQAFSRLGHAIAAFERTEVFHPFSARYDEVMEGKAAFTALEEKGYDLFRSPEAGCLRCHDSTAVTGPDRQTFTNFQYYNLGVPIHTAVREARGDPAPDPGLAGNPFLRSPADAQLGRFKVPTLRNVAVTAPYFHNGVVQDLASAVQLHIHRGAPDSEANQITPETGQGWGATDYPDRIDYAALRLPGSLDEQEIDALVAFLLTRCAASPAVQGGEG